MSASGPAYSNGRALEVGQDYSDTEDMGMEESYEAAVPSPPQTEGSVFKSPNTVTPGKEEGGVKDGDGGTLAPDGRTEPNKNGSESNSDLSPGEDYADDIFESYEMTNDGQPQFGTLEVVS